ncbi:hypothetical protein [Parasphingorhabdus pacifica]
MASSSQHPLEGLYQAREALDQSATEQTRVDLEQLDWPAYGSALLGVLGSLDHFTQVLVGRIDGADRDELYRHAVRDHPHMALDRAVEHLRYLRQVLQTAVSETEGYWEEAQHIREDTADRPQRSE